MGRIASQITSLTSVYSTVYSGSDQSKHQSSASLAFVCGIHRGPVNSPHKWPVTRKMFPFDDVIMCLWWWDRKKFNDRWHIHINVLYENYCSLIKFESSIFPRVQLTKANITLDNEFLPNRRQGIIWTNGGIVYWLMYALLDLNELYIIFTHWDPNKMATILRKLTNISFWKQFPDMPSGMRLTGRSHHISFW